MNFRNRPIIYFSKNKWEAIYYASHIKNNEDFRSAYDISRDYETFRKLIIDQNTIIISGIESRIKLEDARKIKSFYETKSNDGKCCYIFQINNSTLAFQNSILKLIEEREEDKFVFTASTKSQVLPTIVSRCIQRNIKPHVKRDERLMDMALNYNISLTNEEIIKYRGVISKEGFSFIAPKKTDEELVKVIVVWMDILLNEGITRREEEPRKVSLKLSACENFLNLYASKFFSRKVATSEFFNNITKAEA